MRSRFGTGRAVLSPTVSGTVSGRRVAVRVGWAAQRYGSGDGGVFHLGLTVDDLQGATLAIVPGDPARVERIASLMDRPTFLASHREFTSWLAWIGDAPWWCARPASEGRRRRSPWKSWRSSACARSCGSARRAESSPGVEPGDVIVEHRVGPPRRGEHALRADGVPCRRRLRVHDGVGRRGQSERGDPARRRHRLERHLLSGPRTVRHVFGSGCRAVPRLDGRVAVDGGAQLRDGVGDAVHDVRQPGSASGVRRRCARQPDRSRRRPTRRRRSASSRSASPSSSTRPAVYSASPERSRTGPDPSGIAAAADPGRRTVDFRPGPTENVGRPDPTGNAGSIRTS